MNNTRKFLDNILKELEGREKELQLWEESSEYKSLKKEMALSENLKTILFIQSKILENIKESKTGLTKTTFNEAIDSKTTEELIQVINLNTDLTINHDNVSSVFRCSNNLSINMNNGERYRWYLKELPTANVWETPITKENARDAVLTPKFKGTAIEPSKVNGSTLVSTKGFNYKTMYAVTQSWGELILTLDQLQKLFYIKGS